MIIPQIKNIIMSDGYFNIEKILWHFAENTDERVKRAAKRISNNAIGLPVYISHGNSDSEEYTLEIKNNEINITAKGAAGAFYAIMTLNQLLRNSDGKIACCCINDAPDMAYRGFYQDVSRGRIPTLETLKKLVDTMAEYKMNSLQLYVEHSYEFKEYEHCRDLGYLTKSEIQELDLYCKDRFIELIPSLSCFGHLYHLLQSKKYKHLCELNNYIPTKHYWEERMRHHTINPLLDESFNLITSLIDQFMNVFTSNKFNICCDETFDLGTDINKDKNKGDLYIVFVKKLIDYLESKGKTVMMWGDIVLEHPDSLYKLSDKIIFLNWDYEKIPNEDKFVALKYKNQYVCPGTSSWLGFCERVDLESENILKVADYGHKYGANGLLNTNWGDLGNPASIQMAMYGLILGACVSWNIKTKNDLKFKETVGIYQYGNIKTISILEKLSVAAAQGNWLAYNYDWWKYEDSSKEAFETAQQACTDVISEISNEEFKDIDIKTEFLTAAKGISLLIKWSASQQGHLIKSNVDFNKWLLEYQQNWLKTSKYSELSELLKMFNKINVESELTFNE